MVSWRDMMRRRPAAQPETTPEPAEHSFEFAFEGRRVRAQMGQSVGAALLANGIRTLRIDEAGNAKGILCGIGYCFECRCVIDGEPDRRACIVDAREGMSVRRQEGLA
jgi:2Fe-2S iron-sulfur cluster binding domain